MDKNTADAHGMKALKKKTKSTDPNYRKSPTGLILSSFTTRLLREGTDVNGY